MTNLLHITHCTYEVRLFYAFPPGMYRGTFGVSSSFRHSNLSLVSWRRTRACCGSSDARGDEAFLGHLNLSSEERAAGARAEEQRRAAFRVASRLLSVC